MRNRACDNPWLFIPELKPEASSSVEFVHLYIACESLSEPLAWWIVGNEVNVRGKGCKGNPMLVVVCDVLTKYLQRKELAKGVERNPQRKYPLLGSAQHQRPRSLANMYNTSYDKHSENLKPQRIDSRLMHLFSTLSSILTTLNRRNRPRI